MSSPYTKFVNDRRTVEKSAFTHTSMKGGAYYIPGPDEEKLLKLYSEELKRGKPLYMTENPRDELPILIDLDFRFPIDKTERQYTTDMIKEIVKTYVYQLGLYIDLSENTDICVMEKAHPIVDVKKNVVKDGIHIMMPNLVTSKYVQLQVRERCLSELGKILAPLNCSNPIHDIVDEAVIGKNNWTMYGSQKSENIPYTVSHH